MGKQEDIWYAVNVTRVVHAPQLTLETFGSTTIRYHMVSELMDQVNKVRVRAGQVFSERPQIITPGHFASQLLDGFGDKAEEYADWLLSHGEIVKILKYGLQFRNDRGTEELINGSIDDAAAQVTDRVLETEDDFAAVVVGADELWEVSLLKFVVDYIQQSAPVHIEQLTASEARDKNRLRNEIESEFVAAAVDADRVQRLGKKLQDNGFFEEYEDRFYSLVRRLS